MKEKHLVDIEKYIEVFDVLGDAVSIQDRDYKVLYQNDVHIGLVGRHTGEYCYKAYEKKSQRCTGCPLAVTFEDGSLHNAERSAPVGDCHIHVEITSSPIRDSEGNIIAGVELVRDVTEKKNQEIERIKLINDLQKALEKVRVLSGLIPICASCKQIRDDKGFWNHLEDYFSKHSSAVFSHSICPSCAQKLYPDLDLSFKKSR